MNKDDFDRFWTACVPREARASNENIFDDVIESIDNAEKYKHLTESKLLEQYRERGQKIHELSQLKKRLKKELEETEESIKEHELKLKEVSVGFKEYAYNEIKREHEKVKILQKIYEGEAK